MYVTFIFVFLHVKITCKFVLIELYIFFIYLFVQNAHHRKMGFYTFKGVDYYIEQVEVLNFYEASRYAFIYAVPKVTLFQANF